jgi:hypothetical protein
MVIVHHFTFQQWGVIVYGLRCLGHCSSFTGVPMNIAWQTAHDLALLNAKDLHTFPAIYAILQQCGVMMSLILAFGQVPFSFKTLQYT